LPSVGMDRGHRLCLFASRSPELEPVAYRNRRHPIFVWHDLSYVGEAPVSECDLAQLRDARGRLPLFGGAGLPAGKLLIAAPMQQRRCVLRLPPAELPTRAR